MGVEVTATCLHWSQPVVSQSPSSQTLASAILSPSFRTRSRSLCNQALACRLVNRRNRTSALLGQSSPTTTTTTKLFRSPSCDNPKFRRQQPLRRAFSASLDGFSEEEFAEQLQELALRFDQMGDDNDDFDFDKIIKQKNESTDGEQQPENFNNNTNDYVQNPTRSSFSASKIDSVEPPWISVRPEPPDWPETDEIIPSSIERKANSVDLPFSLRILKKKNQWQEGFREAGESAYCSMKKAFSSMVFIIGELHSYTLQMREILFYEDLQGILARVQKETHASFVWLFSQIFSHTPTLMVYVMILLANFTVHSMAHNTAVAAPPPTGSFIATTTTETVSVTENRNHQKPKVDASVIKTFSVSSSSSGKTNFVGGGNGGGGKVGPTSSGTDGGDGQFDGMSSFNHHQIMPDEVSHQLSSVGNPASKEAGTTEEEDEVRLWNSIMEEASKMQAVFMDESLDHETMQGFVSPVSVEIEAEDYQDYFRTELMYQQAVSQDPYNPLLLGNFAQFLYLVVHDHDRADKYFKRAVEVKPADAEVLSLYAHFLWRAKNDLEAAEETFLGAIEADPGNTYYAAKYANFLWNTGGEDTCFPIS